MSDKACENLAAAGVLAESGDMNNASASRAYYAAYQACWFGMISEGYPVPVTDRGQYFPHKELPDLAREAGVLTEEQAEDLEHLEQLRVKADYYGDHVTGAEAKIAYQAASRMLDAIGIRCDD